jgi:subtilisin family serine protease
VFDQGISTTHTDLVDALWVNQAEAKGAEGVDDDGNGYKDDLHGYNFADGKGKPVAKNGADHGTHIAGTIAATNNNGVGVASIAGGTGVGDGVRLMSCQVFKDDGSKASSSTTRTTTR